MRPNTSCTINGSPGQAYSPDTFLDSEGYKAAVDRAEAAYTEWLAKEKGTK